MRLSLRDSLSGEQLFVPGAPARPVGMYVCGPTVYGRAHVGHARTYLCFDLIRRFAEARGSKVVHVMNFTDYEDKITARAAQLGVGWRDVAQQAEQGFRHDLGRLGLLAPHFTPRASAFVPQMIRAIERAERAGLTEKRPEGLYFVPQRAPDPRNFAVGSELARHAVPEPGHPIPRDDAGAREFLLWQRQGVPGPTWPSPWGTGAPGWHVECYAMAGNYLRLPLDVHGGGADLRFPHHYSENELSLALDDRPFAHLFVHTGFVTEHGAKMSKSVGNLVPLSVPVDQVGADALK
ncbi:MAG: class I tRNA ligase family protein, partial [Thermoplasmata archaeon]|nr:class I tRNA ligase family protein [Thermoplasmata archaeon]